MYLKRQRRSNYNYVFFRFFNSPFTAILAIFFFLLLIFISDIQASVILKVMAVNPSKEQTQKVQVKAYLPKEVKPEDIIDKGDLGIAYDTQQGSYYVYGEYELKPKEVLEKEIEIKDIWTIPASELESLRAEANKIAKLLENTDFKKRANFLKESILSKLDEIIKSQKVVSANPEKHISKYRSNLKLLDSIKADLVVARSLLSQEKVMPSLAIWKIFLVIVIFLGILGLSFYIIWSRQLKVITAPTFEKEAGKEVSSPKGEKKEAKEIKKVEAEDIEKIIKEGGE